MRQTYHKAIHIKGALNELREHNPLPDRTPLDTFHTLIDAMNEGKTFYSIGCDKMTHAGRCKGHRAYFEK